MSAIIGFIIGILVALLGLLGLGGFTAFGIPVGDETAQTCIASDDGVERCGPEIASDGSYQLPAAGQVIRSFVHTGPVSPEYQEGYEIVVDADGTVTTTVTPLGASSDLGESEQTAEQIVRIEEIGEAGVQELLTELDYCGFYYLPQSSEFRDEDMPVGGSISIIEVQLEDGTWEVSGALLDGMDEAYLDACQQQLAERFVMSAPA
jgi:hypothetical protein